ncbi:MAG TPA: hypothetical protein VMR25_11835 [Planctomycetaceae bacterium]|jgi:hypothetical protein|nr:hypothetical protein [Planctomycetaceae bacterium]
MSTDSFDRDALEAQWQANERELNRLNSMSGLARETFGARIDELEDEQDAIEFELGKDGFTPTGSRRWSGMP